MTIKDNSNPVELKVKIGKDGSMIIATGDMTIDRTKFDVKYGSDSFFDDLGDKVIYDN